MSFLKRIYHRLFKSESTLDYCYRNGFKSGKNFHCFSPNAIDANWPWLISVGDDVTISSDVKILAHDASTSMSGIAGTKVGIVKIGNSVFIGANSTILCNTRIGDNVIIGAGSVVTKDIPTNSVAAGNPAKVICHYDEYINKHKKLQDSHIICDKHRWFDWKDAPMEDKLEMAKQLENDFGYII